MAAETKIMFTVQCDCCNKNYQDEESGFAYWHELDDAAEWAKDDGWIEKHATSEHEDLQHYCPECFTIDDNDIVITKNGVSWEN